MSRVIPYTPRNVRGRAVLNSRDTFWLPEWVVSRMHHVRGFKGRIRTRRCIEWVRSRTVAQKRREGGKEGRSIAAKWLRELPWLFLRMEPSFFRHGGSSTERGRNRKGWKARTFVCLARERNRADPISSEGEGPVRRLVRPSTSIFTGASMHSNGVLIWQMHSAHFGPRASRSLSFSLSIRYLSPLPLIRSFLLFLCLFDGSRLMERTFSIESNQVSSKSIRFKSKNRFFFFGNESLFHWTFFGTSFFFLLNISIKIV